MRISKFFSKVSCIFFSLIALFFISCSNDDNSEDNNSSKSSSSPTAGQETTSLPELTSTNFDSQAEFAFQCIKLMHPKMAEVWPGDSVLSVDNFNLIMVYATQEDMSDLQMYFVNTSEKTKIANPMQDDNLKAALEQMGSKGYGTAFYKNKKACLMNYSNSEELRAQYEMAGLPPPSDQEIALNNLETFYHESFHFYVQEKTWGATESKNREQVYPIDFIPRTYRMLTNIMLYKAFNNFDNATKRNEYYSKAKYWNEKYCSSSETKDEAGRISLNDINEGTANYFGKAVVCSIFSNFTAFEKPEGAFLASSTDGESYSLGSIALTLIKKEGKLAEAVTKFINNKNNENSIACTPVALLLENTTTPPSSYDESQDNADKTSINTAQEQYLGSKSVNGEKIEKLITYYKEGSKVYILDSASGYQAAGSYKMTAPELSGLSCYVDLKIDTARTTVDSISCFNQKFKIDKDKFADGMSQYMIPVSSVNFIPDNPQPEGLLFAKGSKADEESTTYAEELSDVTVGKISSITAENGMSVTLKEDAKNKEVYKGTDSAGNTYYIFSELAAESTQGQDEGGEN